MTATPKQREFATTLIAERAVPASVAEMITNLLDDPTASPKMGGPISEAIGILLSAPKKAKSAPADSAPKSATRWDGIVVPSMYAIPAETLSPGLQDKLCGNDHLFVQVKRYQGTTYMRRLHGAPGSFSRSKLEWVEVDEVCDVVRTDPKRFADTFSDLYSCCGSCGAELTDAKSREFKLGPECRKKFGV